MATQHRIWFCEPYLLGAMTGSYGFKVSDQAYNLLLQFPKTYENQEECTNAYLFGPLYPLKEYKCIGEHHNDGGMTGFIDYDLLQKARVNKLNEDRLTDEVCKIITAEGADENLEQTVKKIRDLYPMILFQGPTVGGDVGAKLYIHMDDTRHIDSLIIDNDYFFPPSDSDSESSRIRRI